MKRKPQMDQNATRISYDFISLVETMLKAPNRLCWRTWQWGRLAKWRTKDLIGRSHPHKIGILFCTSPKVFVTRSQKHGKKPQAFGWFQASCFELAETPRSNKVAATVPSASCSSFAWLAHCCDGRRDTQDPWETQTDETSSCFWADAESLCDSCSCQWVVWISHATVYGHKILDQFSVYAIPQITGSSQLLQDFADKIRNIFLFCLSLSSRSLVVCCFSMRIANDRSIRGLLHDVEQHYECSNRWDGCALLRQPVL